jgi:hypothetical protein
MIPDRYTAERPNVASDAHPADNGGVRAGLLLLTMLAAWAASSCGCPVSRIRQDRLISGRIVLEAYVRYPDTGPESWDTVGVGDTGPISMGWFKDQPGAAPGTGDLTLLVFEPARNAADFSSSPPLEPIGFQLKIHGFAVGPAEIELDDTRAALKAGPGGAATSSFFDRGALGDEHRPGLARCPKRQETRRVTPPRNAWRV